RRADVESDARAVGRAAAALPLPLDRLPLPRRGGRDPARASPGHLRAARGADRSVHGMAARAAVPQSPGDRGKLGLGAGARAPAPRRARRGDDRAHRRRHPQSARRLGADAGAARALGAPARFREAGRRATRRARLRNRRRAREPGVTARTLEHALSAFTAELRLRHGFDVAQRETHDALRAAETVGIASARRFRAALRIVYCSDPAEVRRFDAAFEAFFRGPRGIAQPGLPSSRRAAPQPAAPAPRRAAGDLEDDGAARERPAREPPGEAATRWEMLRARYSPEARPARPPRVETAGLAAMRVAAGR